MISEIRSFRPQKLRKSRHIHRADIAAHPFLEHVDHEPAVLLRPHRTVGDQRPVLQVQRAAVHVASLSTSPASAIGSVSAVARSMIGMYWMNVAPNSSRRYRYTSRP